MKSSAAFEVKGWCPGALRPMQSGDGLVVRIRPRSGTFNPRQLRALADAARRGEDPTGATMYVTLEPCAHQGRQPPCSEAVIEADIARVAIASEDPTAKAAGKGPEQLREAGIEVALVDPDDEVALEARLLNQPFRKHAKTGRPHVLFKSAMTLDGKVATRTGDSKWISGEDSRRLSHHWRAECDAVAVGIGTAMSDDPQLTARVRPCARPRAASMKIRYWSASARMEILERSTFCCRASVSNRSSGPS